MTPPRIQLALDTRTTTEAVQVATLTSDIVDIVEAGTVLCLCEGLTAVTALRQACPQHRIVADIRIGRAGKKLADLAFEAGADVVTVLGDVDHAVIDGALASARQHGGGVEVELGSGWTQDEVRTCVAAGVQGFIVHRSGLWSAPEEVTIRDDLARLDALPLNQATVTLAGGITVDDLQYFDPTQFDTVAVGSAIVKAADPVTEAGRLRAALDAMEVAT